jgi:hypothetical protein
MKMRSRVVSGQGESKRVVSFTQTQCIPHVIAESWVMCELNEYFLSRLNYLRRNDAHNYLRVHRQRWLPDSVI